MADITISPDEIRSALKDFVAGYKPTAASKTEVGTVIDAADGIAHVEGLPGAMANELLRFADGTLGLALNLDESEIGVIVLGEFAGIEEGMEVTGTGEVLSAPVGDGFLGRVVDPLGSPIDGLGEIKAEGRRALELQAPGVMQRTCLLVSPDSQLAFWLMIVSIAIAVLPVWRSPMISWRCPRPIGIIASMALIPVCIGS